MRILYKTGVQTGVFEGMNFECWCVVVCNILNMPLSGRVGRGRRLFLDVVQGFFFIGSWLFVVCLLFRWCLGKCRCLEGFCTCDDGLVINRGKCHKKSREAIFVFCFFGSRA